MNKMPADADQSDIATLKRQLAERTDELDEARRQQAATADVLKVISRSAFDLDSVLTTLVESAARLCEAERGMIFLRQAGQLHMRANFGFSPDLEAFARTHPFSVDGGSTTARAAASGVAVQTVDILADETQGVLARQYQQLGGHRTNLGVPLRREGHTIGVFTLTRQSVRAFTERQIELVSTFADQAVIAIENARLFEEVQTKTHDLEEALKYQTGSAGILNVIASSPTDVKPVLRAIVESASELCGAYDVLVRLKDGDGLAFGAHHGPLPVSLDHVPITKDSTAGAAILGRKPIHVHDLLSTEGDRFPHARELARMHGERTILSVPLLCESESIGAIVLRRTEVHPFSDKQIALLQTFADQAVIAIQNAKLFDEVQTKTRDLEEALKYQTGSANILNVIASSPTDVGPVLKSIVESACELCEAYDAVVILKDGDELQMSAHHGPIPMNRQRWANDRTSASGRAMADGRPVHVHDVLSDEGLKFPMARGMSLVDGCRTLLSAPLLREGEAIGAIALRRAEKHPFSDKQIALLQTFADQAVIALGNVRLFDEVQARTRELAETLEYQTATSEVLNVISRSPNNLQPVMDTIVQTAQRLCASEYALILQRDDAGGFRMIGHANASRQFLDWLQHNPVSEGDGSAVAIAAAEKKTIHLPDALADPRFTDLRRQRMSKARTMLAVPLMRDDEVIGVVFLARTEVKPFSPRQVDLVTSFADQAVIAISNVNLFEQVQARTRELSQSLDDLRSAQDRLIQTEKLASLGQLTAGIAHEIKNPLNFVNNFSALSVELTDELNEVLKQATLGDKIRGEVADLTGLLKDNLDKVVQHGKRADSIVKSMLLHSREGSGEHRSADVNALVDESLNLAYHGARAEKPQFNVTLMRNFDPSAGTIEVFPQEITRVLLNLISNGFYAVSKRKAENGGTDFEPLVTATTRGSADRVEIRIRDNGTGIPPHVKQKMFNPFFTTKPAGEGTGLGLSMSHDIVVKQHGGTIEVATEPGEFTEFTIVLPRTKIHSNKPRG
jgi:GAF domain-containing protein